MRYLINIVSILLVAGVARAETASIKIIDTNGNPVEHAVVSFISDEKSKNHLEGKISKPVMSQENQQFDPYVLPVSLGSEVQFPNKDNFRHMVYSFSEAKKFQIKLYGGEDKISVTFDKTGSVALGCNIHDNMIGYIYVVDTDHFAKTNAAGENSVTDIPAGEYKVSVWHPLLKGKAEDYDQNIVIGNDQMSSVEFTVDLMPAF